MADDTNSGKSIFAQKKDQPEAKDAQTNATKTTTPVEGEQDKPDAVVTDTEADSLDGAAGANVVPAFGKQDFRDENVQLTDTDDLQSLKDGAAQQSGVGRTDMNSLLAEQAALANGEQPEGKQTYSSAPIGNFKIAGYQFENGLLNLDQSEVGKFEELLGKADARTKGLIRKIDRQAGEAVAKRFLDQQSKSTAGIDNTSNTPQAARPTA